MGFFQRLGKKVKAVGRFGLKAGILAGGLYLGSKQVPKLEQQYKDYEYEQQRIQEGQDLTKFMLATNELDNPELQIQMLQDFKAKQLRDRTSQSLEGGQNLTTGARVSLAGQGVGNLLDSNKREGLKQLFKAYKG